MVLEGRVPEQGSPPRSGFAALGGGGLICKEGVEGLWGSMSYAMAPKGWAQLLKPWSPRTAVSELAGTIPAQREGII